MREYEKKIKDYSDNMLTYEYEELQSLKEIADDRQIQIIKSKCCRILKEQAKREI